MNRAVDSAAYAGVDVGATKLLTVVGTERAADGYGFDGRDRRPTPAESGAAVTAAVLDSLRAACADAGTTPGELAAIGVGSMGPLGPDRGAVVDPPNLPVGRVEIQEPLAKLTGAPVAVYNDAVAGLYGARAAVEDPPAEMVYLTLSTGIGAGVCVGGRVLEGVAGNVGEVGHVVLDAEGRLRCGCGGAGHWEAYCGGANVPRFARYLREHGDCPAAGSETTLDIDGDLTTPAVFDAGDAFARFVVDRIGEYNARGVASLANAFAPELVIVGGSVARENPDRVLGPIREGIGEHLVVDRPTVRLADGDAPVARGALAAAASE